eukprot:TRINITY_DN60834_c0_g1_i1.p1 TRINITY_DN60834_c0_g1~~TRINITY_DN60834_c0_g1_i1.p1  ORF type:complete len:598 (+),score=87.13 TRINITY_DN60834_c0_g1_i1:85-1878(+)
MSRAAAWLRGRQSTSGLANVSVTAPAWRGSSGFSGFTYCARDVCTPAYSFSSCDVDFTNAASAASSNRRSFASRPLPAPPQLRRQQTEHRTRVVGSRFDTLDIDANSLRSLQEVFRYDTMTSAQNNLLPSLLRLPTGGGAVLRAHTGTGKTLAYLVPAIERILRRRPPGVGALVVSPSRELALQITKEVEQLCTYHPLQVVPIIGGTRRDQDVLAIRRRRPAVIVCTPQRLVEHLESTFQFQTLFDGMGTLVLDECDRLLEGNAEDVRELLGFLPSKEARQSVLVSATLPPGVLDLATRVCGAGYELLDCVGDGPPTQDDVEQLFTICPGLLVFTALRNAITEEMVARPASYKVLVFFPTARLAVFAAQLFRGRFHMRVQELHARCSAADRMVTQDAFCKASSGLLFTSGVSERGMDYPDVTLVIQILAPSNREQYVHRVGRTARAGKAGRSLLIALEQEMEAGWLDCLADLPLMKHANEARLLNDAKLLQPSGVPSSVAPPASAAFASLLQHFREVARRNSGGDAAAALEPEAAVKAAAELMMGCGLTDTPVVSAELAEEFGILHVEGLALSDGRKESDGDGRRPRTRVVKPSSQR